jgi:hypothetical protein
MKIIIIHNNELRREYEYVHIEGFDKNEIANREILIHKIDDDVFNPSGAAAQVRMND